MLENLKKFLKENNIEIPEGTDANGVLEIISALLKAENADGGESGDGSDGKPPADKEVKETQEPLGAK